jgi:catalase
MTHDNGYAPPQGGGAHDTATHDAVETAKTVALKHDTVEPREVMTSNQGLKISDDQNSEKAGVRGGSLLEDFLLREKITAFDHERIPERVVHARGAGAHGYFEAYEDLSALTMAAPFSEKGKRTPVFTRFSTVAGSRGSADTPRDVRGFAVKFYTDAGVWDLVGNDIPVFFINDAIKFPDLIHAVKPEPHIEIPQAASAHDTFWDFASLSPEISHMIMWVMSDRGLPRSFANMEGFGVHTWRLGDAKGGSRFVKFHWKPVKGVQSQVWDEAQKTAGKDADYQRRDMFESIERGDFLEWELGIQVVEEKDEFAFDFDLLDDTKLIPEELVPVRIVGKMVLNRNPDNYFAETEQVAFCVSHVVPGIDFTNDPMLQGRLHSYLDTQLRRIGPNFAELPINRPLNPVSNNRRDGFAKNTINKGRVAYFPSALGGVHPMHQPQAVDAFRSYAEKVDGHKIRARSTSFTDYFTQATMFFNSLADWEKKHLIEAIAFELNQCETKAVPKAVMANLLVNIHPELAAGVAEQTGLDIEECKRVAPKPVVTEVAAPKEMPSGRLKVERSPALSMDKVTKGIKGRKIAVLAGEGVDGEQLGALRSALEAQGAVIEVIADRGGTITCSLGKSVKVDRPAVNAPSVIYDAVAVPGGKSAEKLAKTGLALAFVAEAFKHGKPLVFMGEGQALIAKAHLPVPAAGAPEQGVTAGTAPAAVAALVTGLEKHRYHNRDIEAVAA